jgi:hypothetical protein
MRWGPGLLGVGADCIEATAFAYAYERVPSNQAGSDPLVAVGGCGGGPFSFHDSTQQGSTIQEIRVWTIRDNTLIKAIWFKLFNGETYTIGRIPEGNPAATFEFEVGETLSGSIVLTVENNPGVRLGHVSFQTSRGRAFTVGSAKTSYLFDSQESFLTGFFGLHGDDVDKLGLYLTKKIRKQVITNVTYDMDQTMVPQKPEQFFSHDFKNPHLVTDKHTFDIKREISTTRQWSIEAGMTFSASLSVEAGVPLAAKTTVGYELSVSAKASYTSTTFVSNSVQESIALDIPPCSFGQLTASFYESTDPINFSANQTIVFVDDTELVVGVKGVYTGVVASIVYTNKDGIFYYTTGVCAVPMSSPTTGPPPLTSSDSFGETPPKSDPTSMGPGWRDPWSLFRDSILVLWFVVMAWH